MQSRAMKSAVWLALAASTAADQYGYNHVSVRQDSELVAANFQDVEGIDLLSPAFQSPESVQPGFADGTQGPTSHDLVESFMKSLADKHDWMTYKTANFTSEEGRRFPYVLLSSTKKCRSNSTSVGKVRVWFQGGVHGNEPAGDQSVLAFLGHLDANISYAASLLSRTEILVLPRYNPDGVFYFQRTLATNFDPNRDHVKLARSQTRSIKQLLSSFNPHVAIDMHEYTAPAIYGGNYQPGSDGLFSAAKNPNISPRIRNISESLFAVNMGNAMEGRGLRWEPYVTGSTSSTPGSTITYYEAGSDAKIGRNAMGLTQSVTFLIETRGIGIADQEFQRRTVASLTMAEAIIEIAAYQADEVLSAIEGGIEDFVAGTDDIIITDTSEASDRTFTMVDVNNGSVVQVPIRFYSTTPVIPVLTRARPEGYLIPPAWADLAERLKVSGLEVQTLEDGFSGTVEALTIASTTIARAYYEGVVRVTATTTTATRELTLPKGTFYVSTRQKNAALAFVALEPENIDSYVTFNIVPMEIGDEYPVYRVMA